MKSTPLLENAKIAYAGRSHQWFDNTLALKGAGAEVIEFATGQQLLMEIDRSINVVLVEDSIFLGFSQNDCNDLVHHVCGKMGANEENVRDALHGIPIDRPQYDLGHNFSVDRSPPREGADLVTRLVQLVPRTAWIISMLPKIDQPEKLVGVAGKMYTNHKWLLHAIASQGRHRSS